MERISKVHDVTAVKKETKDSKNNNKGQSFKETLRLKMQEYEEKIEEENEQQSDRNMVTEKVSIRNVVPQMKKVDVDELRLKKKKDNNER